MGGEKTIRWFHHDGNALENELYVFPGSSFFDRVNKTNGGRIFHLNFADFDDKYFFWLQEPDQSKDDHIVKQVNDIINFDETVQPVPVANTTTNPNVTNASLQNQNLGAGINF